MQVNLQKKKLATQELMLEAGRRKTAFALVSEPYIGNTGELKQQVGTRIVQRSHNRAKVNKAAIVVFDPDIEITEFPLISTENIVAAVLNTDTWTIGVVSFYLEDNQPIETDIDKLKEICAKLQAGRVIIGGDTNAWSTWWGSTKENHRGEAFAGALVEMGMEVLNEGTEPTFYTSRGGKIYQSHVDVTACKTSMLSTIQNWRIDNGIISSDHNAIIFTISLEKPIETRKTNSTRKYNTKKADWNKFSIEFTKSLENDKLHVEHINNIDNIHTLEKAIYTYIDSIEKACKATIPKIKKVTKTNLPWWSEELSKMKNEVKTKKRRIACAAPRRRPYVIREYLKIKEKYELAASEAQTTSWKRFCGTQDRESMWDGVYRVLRSTAKRYEDQPLIREGRVLSPEESAEHLAATFFPDDETTEDNGDHHQMRLIAALVGEEVQGDKQDPPFTETELQIVINSLNPKKAPGSDGFTADICEMVIKQSPKIYLTLVNKCLELSYFPTPWKEAAVVVLRKPGKDDYSHAKAYRPIGLLSILGKIMEKMMIRRVRWHLLPKLNPRQYGFTPQRCTEDSLYDLVQHIKNNLRKKLINVVVSLDIEGAFDSAWWPAIKIRLLEKRCPQNLRRLIISYFTNRSVNVGYAGKVHRKHTTKGCVQGSIGGPTFWNVLLDSLLDELERDGIYCQAFADDIVLVFSEKTVRDIERIAENTLRLVDEWGSRNKLKFAAQKTHAMMITNKIKLETPLIRMGETIIQMRDEIKILGLILDQKLNFNKHVSHVCNKATNVYKQLCRAAKISWGLNPDIIRTIYVAVVEPIILYAASVWAPATGKLKVQQQLNTVQRGFAQKIIKSYRTVSLSAALTLSGLLPLDMRIRENAQLYEAKRGKPQEILRGRKVERRVCYLQAPHPAKEIAVDFVCLENMQPENLEHHQVSGACIFTDGSKIEGKVGAAISHWRNGSETRSRKFRLESYCTVFQAEMLALLKATELALKGTETVVNIFSDSRSALELLRDPGSFNPLAHEIRNNIMELRDRNMELRLFWVRAHIGVEGNERADSLAKEAALYKKSAPDYERCPVSFIKRQIRLETKKQWSKRYASSETATVTKLFLPETDDAYKMLKKLKLGPTLVQALTGHGGFGHYLHRFKCKESPACICDPAVEETIIHLMLDCPKYDRKRLELQIQLEFKLCIENLPILLKGEHRDLFIKFLKYITIDVRKRNKTNRS